MTRERIAKTLKRQGSLRTRIDASISIIDGNTVFEPEWDRVKSVLIKLAQGHALYELHELVSFEPDDIWFFPLHVLTEVQRSNFESVTTFDMWPEVGSRAMQRMISGQDINHAGWIIVQPNTYRYVTSSSGAEIEVKIAISEYLGCIVKWFP
ncbi:MAG: hypothetical protein D9N14_02510 [Ketobacter sp.]|uniref:Uncharacterized protein n=1 Tax=Microbulbifer harenosus TaxID=2576840 RepID=A0ABY2ULS8_9GAMM|nr:MAG: hypothetical protein D9N14_02510 [Ketobacter sp.]TLM79392.1 hypothetical protein FDY93_03370 [Microbulbifer harenosus]